MSINSLITNETANSITVYIGNNSYTLTHSSPNVNISSPGTISANDSSNHTWTINVPSPDNTKYALVYTGQSTTGITQTGYTNLVFVYQNSYYSNSAVCTICPSSGCPSTTVTYSDSACANLLNGYSCGSQGCVVTPEGNYPDSTTCQANCLTAPSTYYLTGTNSCTACPSSGCPSTTVTYSDSACSNIINGYACNNGKCSVVAKGTYKDLPSCQRNCLQYYCNSGTCLTCVGQNCPSTTYTTLATCQSSCKSSSNSWWWILIVIGIIVILIIIALAVYLLVSKSKKKSAAATAADNALAVPPRGRIE